MEISPQGSSRVVVGAHRRHVLLGFLLILGTWSAPAFSAFVTLHEAAVETIYTQVYTLMGYSGSTFDIIYHDVEELVAPDLLVINDEAEFTLLNTLADTQFSLANTTVPMFYVDNIKWCGGNGAVAGCAGTSHAVLKSSTAAGGKGEELVAHELGHTLGLVHPEFTPAINEGTNNLLQPVLANGQTDLVAAQVSGDYDVQGTCCGNAILDSAYVLGKLATGDLRINIAPILVVAAATTSVPLPAPALLLAGALVPLIARRRHTA